MLIDDLIVNEEVSVLSAMRQLDTTGRKILFIAPNRKLIGILTDSDIRRFIMNGGSLEQPVKDAANYSPKYISVEQRAQARDFLLRNNIDAVPILDNKGSMTDIVFLNDLDIDSHKKLDLPVVIMAGGLGTRLFPYTKILPKPLIPVGELPIVEHIMSRFCSFGCSRFNMIVNYKKSMIKSYFADSERQYRIVFTDEDRPLGTGGGLSLLKNTIDETFFLTNCDVLIDADYGDLYEYHKANQNVITVVCAFKHITIPYGVIELGEGGEIRNVTEKPEMSFLTNTGMYLVEPRVIQELEEGVAIGFPDIMERYRKKGEKVGVYPVSENSWMDMGQLEELDEMRRRLEQG